MQLSSYERVRTTADAVVDELTARSLLRNAMRLRQAVQVSSLIWEVHRQRNCLVPVLKQFIARPAAGFAGLSVRAMYRCRRCEGCMDAKSRMWAAKACAEFRQWPVTLMGTFTLSPEQHALLDAEVARRVPTAKLTSAELFAERERQFYIHFRKWVNVVRSAAYRRNGGRRGVIRYLQVAEAHDGPKTSLEMRGRPHFHCLIHEVERGALIEGAPLEAMGGFASGEYVGKKYERSGQWLHGVFLSDEAMLRTAWELGFSKFQVCFDENSAFYVCKYMSKHGAYRTRASQHYGALGSEVDDTATGSERADERSEVGVLTEEVGAPMDAMD